MLAAVPAGCGGGTPGRTPAAAGSPPAARAGTPARACGTAAVAAAAAAVAAAAADGATAADGLDAGTGGAACRPTAGCATVLLASAAPLSALDCCAGAGDFGSLASTSVSESEAALLELSSESRPPRLSPAPSSPASLRDAMGKSKRYYCANSVCVGTHRAADFSSSASRLRLSYISATSPNSSKSS